MKKFKFLIISLIGIILIIVGFFFIKDNVLNSNNEERLPGDSDLVQLLFYNTRTNYYGSFSDNLLYFYEQDKVLVSEMDQDYIYNLVFYQLNPSGDYSGSIEEETVKDKFLEIFGSNVIYEVNESFIYGCSEVLYDSISKMYTINLDNTCVDYGRVSSYVDYAIKTDDKLEIYEKVLFTTDYETYYFDYEMTKNAGDIFVDSNDERILRYKYTFTYDKDKDLYYFYSVEKVKK